MSERIQPTGGPDDPFYQVWQRVSGTGEEKGALSALPQAPEMSLNEWLQRQLREVSERESLCRAWQALRRFVPLCRREREVLGTALFLRTGLCHREQSAPVSSRDLPQDCRRLCLLFHRSAGHYSQMTGQMEGSRLSLQMEQLGKSCRQAGEQAEGLLEEILRQQGYI